MDMILKYNSWVSLAEIRQDLISNIYCSKYHLKLNGKHCRKPHCRNGVVDHLVHSHSYSHSSTSASSIDNVYLLVPKLKHCKEHYDYDRENQIQSQSFKQNSYQYVGKTHYLIGPIKQQKYCFRKFSFQQTICDS